MKRSFSAALALGLLATPAMSQTTTTPPTTTPPPATTTTPPATTTTPPAVRTTPPASSTQAQGAIQQRWYTAQPDDMRASKLIGTTVRNTAGDNIGDINEILLDKSGRVAAVVVGVGGFLGIGEREVAMSWSSLQVRADGSNTPTITANVSRDELRGAPAMDRSGNRPR
jgi:hypothetical protein